MFEHIIPTKFKTSTVGMVNTTSVHLSYCLYHNEAHNLGDLKGLVSIHMSAKLLCYNCCGLHKVEGTELIAKVTQSEKTSL